MAIWLFVEWLLIWLLDTTTFAFEWDQGNRTKNATKHDVTTDEVESVFGSNEPSLSAYRPAPSSTNYAWDWWGDQTVDACCRSPLPSEEARSA